MTLSEEAMEKFSKNEILISTQAFRAIVGGKITPERIILKAKEQNVWFITKEFLEEFVLPAPTEAEKQELKEISAVSVERRGKTIPAKEIESQLKIDYDLDVTGQSTCSGKLADFLDYFTRRYENIRDVLKERPHMGAGTPIENARRHKGEKTTIVGMIQEKRESKNGFKFLEVEDLTGETTVLIPKNNERMIKLYDGVLPDNVIGISGTFKNNLFVADEIVEPEMPLIHNPPIVAEPVSVVFLSDIHVGSYLFLEREFERFIDWINLNGDDTTIPERIKYILIAGDLVDGIGIYPNQERELSIPDIYKQYDYFAGLLEKIPDYIEIVVSVGNHDALRTAEPQPKIGKDLAEKLYSLPNVHCVGNPSRVETHGVKTLIYHGTSLDTIIGSFSHCTYSRPEIAMTELLKKRSLLPTYGNDSMSPEQKDYLFIGEVPDILHCGHVHTNGYGNYRGVRVINSGTFQGRTKYQEMLGHQPTPARVPVINLQNFDVTIAHFQE